MTSKILILDIETAPNIAYVWGAWKQNVGQNQWVEKSHIMSYAAKWLGDDKVFYHENRKKNDKALVQSLYSLLDEADIVVAHNGVRFDLPVVIGRGVIHGLVPPSPYHTIDTLLVARKEFRFVSNSLANLSQELGLPLKKDHKKFPGFELWLECLRNNDEAWAEMKDYNVADIITLEALYLRLRPYMKYHPNIAKVDEKGDVACPKCSSEVVHFRGYYTSKSGYQYRRFQCQECMGWGRARLSDKDHNKNMGVNAV